MENIVTRMARLLYESPQKYRKFVLYLDLCFVTESCDDDDQEARETGVKWHAFHIKVRKSTDTRNSH